MEEWVFMPFVSFAQDYFRLLNHENESKSKYDEERVQRRLNLRDENGNLSFVLIVLLLEFPKSRSVCSLPTFIVSF